MQTDYPRSGKINIIINKADRNNWSLYLRIPGWARGNPLAGNLYRFLDQQNEHIIITLNGKKVNYTLRDGFAVIQNGWKSGDKIELTIPMPVRRVIADARVKDDAGRAAVLRGPLVYCAEGVDNNHFTRNLILPDEVAAKVEYEKELFDGLNVIKFNGQKKIGDDNSTADTEITLIPYYGWAQRGANEMTVWLPRKAEIAEWPSVPAPQISPRDTIVIKPGKIKVALSDKIANSKIRYTVDGSAVTEKSSLYGGPFMLSDNTLIKYRAFKKGLKASETVSKYFAFVDEKVNGLNYAYYEGNWQKLPEFENLKPLKKGTTFRLSPKPLSLREDGWGLVFTGYIKIESPGEYTFYLESNDGSRLFIDDALIVNNDGQHGVESKKGAIRLKRGKHPIKIKYFESGGSEFLKLYYKGPCFDKIETPASMLFRSNS